MSTAVSLRQVSKRKTNEEKEGEEEEERNGSPSHVTWKAI